MRVAVYARTSKREGEPLNQLLQLRDFCGRQGWEIMTEYVDHGVPAKDMRGRVQWAELQRHVRRGGIDVVVCTKLDRAFRSSLDTYTHLAEWDARHIRFVAVQQLSMDTTPTGRLILGVLAAVAEFERSLIVERTLDGIARARAEGVRLGRPKGRKDGHPRKKGGYYLRHMRPRMTEASE